MIFKRDIKIYLTLVLFLKKKILFIKKRSNHFSNPKEIKKIKYPPNIKNAKTPCNSYAKVGRYQKKKFK